MAGSGTLRWRLADDDRGQATLFPDERRQTRHIGRGEFRGLEFLHVEARRIINRVPDGARVPFRFTINAYRGCSHACTYCFARPTHEYLGLGLGEDFERKLVVKINAVERVVAELRAPSWTGELIAMGTNTDPYQRAEGKYHLTRGIVEALGAAANPFSVLTKSTLILRDIDVLLAAATRTEVRCNLSIGTLDPEVWRTTEPGTPHPRQRVAAVGRLVAAGLDCGVLVAPVIPGLSDRPDQLADVVRACVDAGATSIGAIPLHLRPGIRAHFLDRLARTHPEVAADLERRYRAAYLPAGQQRPITDLVRRVAGQMCSQPGSQSVP